MDGGEAGEARIHRDAAVEGDSEGKIADGGRGGHETVFVAR